MDDEPLADLDEPIAWLCGSPFEWFAMGSGILPPAVVEAGVPIIATLYDLIPLWDPPRYLSDPAVRRRYEVRCELVCWADLVPCVSQYTATDAHRRLGICASRLPVVGAGVSTTFCPGPAAGALAVVKDAVPAVRGPFVMTVASDGPHKNLDGLVDAWALLDRDVRRRWQLLVAGRLDDTSIQSLTARALAAGLAPGDIVWAGYITDDVLIAAYRACSLFVSASRVEGFGLPVAEAIACGAAAVCSENGAMYEILELPEAGFDPANPASIAGVIEHGLRDRGLRRLLLERGRERRRLFTWASTVDRLITAVGGMAPRATKPGLPSRSTMGRAW
jgi:glycosyltransferase involved in cell wall biosynthesis